MLQLSDFAFAKMLTSEDFAYLQTHAKKVSIPKESIVFYQDDICNDILLLGRGEIELYMHAENDKKIPLYTLKAGEQCVINTSSTISRTPTIGTAQSLSDVEGWMIHEHVVKELMHRSPAYLNFVFSLFTLKFDALATLIQDIKFKKLDSRILSWLKSHNTSLVYTTHEVIAEAMGTSRVVVSRVLKDLEKQHLIIMHHKSIEIL
ncbi:MAG: Crp/Fnr family transcriptional regulator [Sulfurospirillaceae bacterium]|nr:Crp/Fnr family transcriptional regulator [Sulfurospirillaceae bacterium]